MRVIQRLYCGDADKTEMAALARAFPAEHTHVIDLPYRLSSWAFDFPENVGLWVDSDEQLAAWAVLQKPFWTIDCACHPAAQEELYPLLLAWADQRARQIIDTPGGRPAWYINVFSDQTTCIHILEEAGFTSQANAGTDAWSKVFMLRPGSLPVDHFRIPPGFTIHPLAGEDEVEAYVALHQAVFETKNMTVAWRRRIVHHPDYRPDLDLVVSAPDGRLAAFCIGWLDPTGRSGQIEPLGCHADFRRYALGRLALAEVLRRLQKQGVGQIYVETDNYRDTAFRLYQSLGFEVVRDILVFSKDYA
jgi:ribosomal protein S18 acetylase RimI-like enzyme